MSSIIYFFYVSVLSGCIDVCDHFCKLINFNVTLFLESTINRFDLMKLD